MNTATPPAMMAVIEITMTISISVTPAWRSRLRQRIGRITHAVAVKNHGGVARPRHGHGDQQAIRRENGAQGLIGHGNGGGVRLEARYGIAFQVTDGRS